MCTLVILRRPAHRWPLLIAANRDEMAERPWRPPGRHWPDRPDVVGGLDEFAGGTWCAINDGGVVAAILNRINTLGPAPGLRSRGELPLEALDHPEAHLAAAALADLNPQAYRPFNLLVADARHAYWIRLRGGGGDDPAPCVDVLEVPEGYSMITAYDRNDLASPRIRRYLPLFRAAAVPDPDAGDWNAWTALLAERTHDPEAGPGGAMNVVTATGFGTICSSLLALPAVEPDAEGDAEEIRPIWRFAAWTDAPGDYSTVAL